MRVTTFSSLLSCISSVVWKFTHVEVCMAVCICMRMQLFICTVEYCIVRISHYWGRHLAQRLKHPHWKHLDSIPGSSSRLWLPVNADAGWAAAPVQTQLLQVSGEWINKSIEERGVCVCVYLSLCVCVRLSINIFLNLYSVPQYSFPCPTDGLHLYKQSCSGTDANYPHSNISFSRDAAGCRQSTSWTCVAFTGSVSATSVPTASDLWPYLVINFIKMKSVE